MIAGTKLNLSHSNPLFNVVASASLQQVHSIIYLGVHIDDTLSWSKHVRTICKTLFLLII